MCVVISMDKRNQERESSIVYPKLNKLSTDKFYYTRRHGDTVYIDMDGVVADYKTAYEGYFNTTLDMQGDIPHTPPGFYRSLPVIEGAKSAVLKIMEHCDVYFCSSPSWHNTTSYSDKADWLKDTFGHHAEERLILTHNKSLMIGSVLIDDRHVHGVTAFKGLHIQFGSDEYPDWNSVIRKFEQCHFRPHLFLTSLHN